ncbi:MarR family winged helix-turn-helix transcriptional regulator [Comamonas humi]
MTEVVRERERLLASALSELGLGLPEWRALRILNSFPGDVPMSTVAEHSQTDRTALGRTIDRMETRGWVQRIPAPEDKRAVYIRLSLESRGVFAKALKLVAAFDEQLLAMLTSQEQTILPQMLEKMVSSVRNH